MYLTSTFILRFMKKIISKTKENKSSFYQNKTYPMFLTIFSSKNSHLHSHSHSHIYFNKKMLKILGT